MTLTEALHLLKLAVDITLMGDFADDDKRKLEEAYTMVATKTRTADRLEGIRPGIRIGKDERGGWLFKPRESAPILSASLDRAVTAALEYTTAIDAE